MKTGKGGKLTAPYCMTVLILAVGLLAGCRSTGGGRSIPGIQAPAEITLNSLSRSEYSVLGQVEGAAEYGGGGFLFWSWYDDNVVDQSGMAVAEGGERRGGFFLPGGGSPIYQTMRRAINDALSKIAEADMLLTPRFHWTWRRSASPLWGFFYRSFRVEVTVRGRAIRLKTDEELAMN